MTSFAPDESTAAAQFPIQPRMAEEAEAGSPEKAFISCTNQMLREISEGSELGSDQGFQLWKDLTYENFEIGDAISRIDPQARLKRIVPFVSFLPLPSNIKLGMKQLYLDTYMQHVTEHPDDMGPLSKKALQLEHDEDTHYPLINRYRSHTRIARTISSTFDQLPLSRAEDRWIKHSLRRSPIGISDTDLQIFSMFRLTGREDFSYSLVANENLLHEYYLDSPHLNSTVDFKFRSESFTKKEIIQLREVCRVLLTFAGEIPENRAEVLQRYKGRFPIALGPEVWKPSPQGWVVQSSVFGMRCAYGLLPHTREGLEARQAEIERGIIRSYSVRIRGRVDARFLAELSGPVYEGKDPIPDIELLKEIILPSGRPYLYIIKAARRYSCLPNYDLNEYSEEDRRVIHCLSEYYLDPAHKQRMSVICDFRIADYPEDLRNYLKRPETIASIKVFQQICAFWNHSVCCQLLESEGALTRLRPRLDWMDPELQDYSLFLKRCRYLLQEIPFTQATYKPEYLTLKTREIEEFLEFYGPFLFHKICGEELSRIKEEEENGAHTARIALGYRGPVEGYGLPLFKMLRDCIIDYRKRQHYCEQYKKNVGYVPFIEPELSPFDTRIPRNVGRRYDTPELFFGPEKLPEVLAEMLRTNKARRTIKFQLYDPTQEDPFSEYPVSHRDSIEQHLLESNFSRIQPFVMAYLDTIQKLAHNKKLPALEYTCFRIFRQMFADATSKTEKLLAQKSLSAKNPRRMDALRKMEFLYENFFPTYFCNLALRAHSIQDQHIASFIIGIGSDGRVRLGEENIQGGHEFRHTHSQLLGAKNGYGVGRLVLGLHDRQFHSLPEWEEFNTGLKAEVSSGSWKALRLDDGTGHYMVLSDSLEYLANVTLPQLQAVGISTSDCKVVSCLAPGLGVRLDRPRI